MKSKSTRVKSFPADQRRFTPNWSDGRYEQTAEQLLPAAHQVIELAAPRPGEQVLDIGCGTGNAALLAAEQGADVTGVDPAERLVAVASAHACARGVEARFLVGQAERLPVADASADLVLSVFAVIFAGDPKAAIQEIARVTKPGGRAVIAAWIPRGAISESTRVVREAVIERLGAPAPAAMFAWHAAETLTAAFGQHGFEVTLHSRELSFRAASPEAHVQSDFENHPMWLAARRALGADASEAIRERAIEILTAANESAEAFQVTSSYVIAVATRSA